MPLLLTLILPQMILLPFLLPFLFHSQKFFLLRGTAFPYIAVTAVENRDDAFV